MAGDIEQWLAALDLTKYRDAFAENEIEFGDLAADGVARWDTEGMDAWSVDSRPF